MSAIINQYPQLDVEFAVLNDLAKRLRTAGAKISVRKVGEIHRVTVLKEPTVATVEQILNYIKGVTEDDIDTPTLTSNDAIASNPLSPFSSPSETTDTPNPPELATLEDLLTLPLEKLKGLAKFYKVTGFSKIKSEKLAAKLQGLVTKQQVV